MKVIWFNGNLGNQVFYCRYKDYLQEKYPNETIYAYIDPKCPKVTVEQKFNLALPKQSCIVNILSFCIFKLLGVLFRRIPSKLVPGWYCGAGELNDSASFIGHSLQVKSYYENESSSWLKIREGDNLTEEYRAIKNEIENCNAVSVHLRRGDYVHPGSSYVDLSATSYYDSAMAVAKDFYPDCQFFFFSDDMEYVRSKFKGDNIHYVDCNRGSNSYLDIQLMSLAKVNIMANSTFSYWGAYMNNENKKVIYPRQWFCEWTGRKAPDIMLNNWIGI